MTIQRRYAARSEPRKPSTSDFSRSDCDDKPLAASSRLRGGHAGFVGGPGDAVDIVVDVPGAVRRLLHVAGDFARRRALLIDGVGDLRWISRRSRRWSRRWPGSQLTASPVAVWMLWICAEISSVAFAVWLASALTSLATTANPLPCSPARAASMVAFRASRLVWLAMFWISVTTSPIFWVPLAKSLDHGVGAVRLLGGLAGDLGRARHLLGDLCRSRP